MANRDYFPRVESYLGKYAKWRGRLDVIDAELAKLKPSLTPTYSDIPPSITNKTSDNTGDMATRRVDLENERECIKDKIYKLEVALGALTDEQRNLFELRYRRGLAVDDVKDSLKVGRNRYYQVRDSLVETVHKIIQDAIY